MAKKTVAPDTTGEADSGSAASVEAKTAKPAEKADIKKDFDATVADTKALLDKQPKVKMFVPLENGEPAGTILPVNINGHRYNVPKGQTVDVPQTVAEVIAESLRLPVSSLDLSAAGQDKKAALNV